LSVLNKCHSADTEFLLLGAYLLTVLWSGQHVPGSPFKVNVMKTSDASKVTVSGDGLKNIILGREGSVLIDARTAGPGLIVITSLLNSCDSKCFEIFSILCKLIFDCSFSVLVFFLPWYLLGKDFICVTLWPCVSIYLSIISQSSSLPRLDGSGTEVSYNLSYTVF